MERIQVVLASPSDLQEERQMIRELVNSLPLEWYWLL